MPAIAFFDRLWYTCNWTKVLTLKAGEGEASMKKIKWEYVPVAGFVTSFVGHLRSTSQYHKNPTGEAYDATWEAFRKYHIALVCTFVPFALVTVLAVIFVL